MTPQRLAEIAACADAADSGPWEVMNAGDNETVTFIEGPDGDVLVRDMRGSGHLSEEYTWVSEPNARFITNAREYVPELVTEVRRLRAMLGD